MNDFASLRFFRLSPGGIECDEDGLRVGGVALLARDAKGVWAPRDERDLGHELSRTYGFPVDVRPKLAAFATVANALQNQNIAKAQIAALLLQLPDPLPPERVFGKADRGLLARDLVACGLLKADDSFDEKHPRTHSPPNPGWFAPKPKESENDSGAEATKPTPNSANPDTHGDSEPTNAIEIDRVAYQGNYHDFLLQDEIEWYRKAGAICISEVRLTLGANTSRLDILCSTKLGGLMGAEVKTGEDPKLTPDQIIVDSHSLFGGLSSPDSKISALGYARDATLPPFPIFIVYAAGPGAPKRYFGPVK